MIQLADIDKVWDKVVGLYSHKEKLTKGDKIVNDVCDILEESPAIWVDNNQVYKKVIKIDGKDRSCLVIPISDIWRDEVFVRDLDKENNDGTVKND